MTDSDYNPEIVIKNQGGKMLTLISFLVAVLALNYLLYGLLLSNIMTRQLSSAAGIATFIVLTAAVFVAGHYILSNVIGHKFRDAKGLPLYFFSFHKATRLVFYVSAAIHAIIILQMVLASQYYVGLSIGTMAASYLLGSVILAYLSYRFLNWYRTSRERTMLLFGIAFSVLAASLAIIALVNSAAILLIDFTQTEGAMTSGTTKTPYGKVRDSWSSALFLVTLTPSRIAFAFYWIGTALLLRNYSKTIGRMKFWIIISLPLVIFFIATVLIFGNIANSQFTRVVLILPYAISSGILFAVIFITTATSLSRMKHEHTARYLTLAGYGTLLFIMSTAAPVHVVDWLHTPYPAFASSGWSIACIALYLYSFGIFFSASAISKDVQLRKSIKKIVADESRLFGSIGAAQMESELTARISKIVKEQETILEEQEGIRHDIDETEIKSYLNEAIEEVRKAKKESGI